MRKVIINGSSIRVNTHTTIQGKPSEPLINGKFVSLIVFFSGRPSADAAKWSAESPLGRVAGGGEFS
jgi:hypothetical protein